VNNCIEDDTKAAACQSLNCIKNKKNKNMAKKWFFNMPDGILTPCNVARSQHWFPSCGMWLWNRDNEFTKWQHPAMWHIAVGWHAIEFAQMSAILEFYIMVSISTHHHSRHVILYHSAKFYPNRTTLGRKKWCHVDFQDGGSQPSWIVGIQWWVLWKAQLSLHNFDRSSIDTIALACGIFAWRSKMAHLRQLGF